MSRSDAELLSLIRTDPERGLSEAIDIYSGYVYAIIRNRLAGFCTAEDMEEAVSDVFADLYAARDKIDLEKSPLKACLSVIAKRTAIDFRRKAARAPRLVSSDDEESGLAETASAENLEETAERRDGRRRLLAAVKALGEPGSTILLRRFWLGETARETALATGLSANAVTKRTARELERLRDILAETE